MDPSIAIRAERPGDAATIARVVVRAYADVAYSDHREQVMIDRLRETDAFVPALSLLALVGGEPAGHVLLTRARIRDGDRRTGTLALAPLSVVPAHRRRGVGRRLVETAHAQAAALGFGSIVVVGIPGYFPRFGYEPLSLHPIALPFAAPADNRLILPLRPHALAGVTGTVDYADGWLEH